MVDFKLQHNNHEYRLGKRDIVEPYFRYYFYHIMVTIVINNLKSIDSNHTLNIQKIMNFEY